MLSRTRFITVILGFALALLVIIFAPPLLLRVAICLVALLSLNEYLRMYQLNKNVILYCSALGSFLLLGLTLFVPDLYQQRLFEFASLVLLIAGLITRKVGPDVLYQTATAALGVSYVAFLPYYLISLHSLPQGKEWILLLCAGTWGRDVGAFLVGKVTSSIGHRMATHISQTKTYEGALGGLIVTIVLVILTSKLVLPWLHLSDVLAISLLIGIFGQIGDLVESWLKRNATVTDSSHLLPGQGGLLDSFDSFIFTGPALYIYVSQLLI